MTYKRFVFKIFQLFSSSSNLLKIDYFRKSGFLNHLFLLAKPMDSFFKTVNSGLETLMRQTMKSVIEELASQIADKIDEGEKPSAKEIIVMWNSVIKDSKLKIGGKKKDKDIDPNVDQCEHIFAKGEKSGKQCTDAVSDKSKSGKYCSKHYVQGEKEKKSSSDDEAENLKCVYRLKKGEKLGQECKRNVSSKSPSKQFCSKHLKEEEKDDKEVKKKKGKKNEKKEKKQLKVTKYKDPKSKDLKGMCYFEDKDVDVKFVYDSTQKKVIGKDVKGKLIDLDDDDIDKLHENYKVKYKDDKEEKLDKKSDKKTESDDEDNDKESDEEESDIKSDKDSDEEEE